jgi:protein-S-isoprenylcysteine O-methyltransferase Ste14
VFEAAFFLVLIAALLAGFGKDLRNPRRHEFPRFFAFASALALVAYSARFWFADPFSPRQLVSWLLLAGSAAAVASGRSALLKHGAPAGGIESTTRLVSVGIYRRIRHPLYLSVILIAAACALKRPDPVSAVLFVAAASFAALTARKEEQEDLGRFGAPYAEYLRATKRFLPWIF